MRTTEKTRNSRLKKRTALLLILLLCALVVSAHAVTVQTAAGEYADLWAVDEGVTLPLLHAEYACAVPPGSAEWPADPVTETVAVIRERLANAGFTDCAVFPIGANGIAVEISLSDPAFLALAVDSASGGSGDEAAGSDAAGRALDLAAGYTSLRFLDPEGNAFMYEDMVASAEYVTDDYTPNSHQVEIRLTDEGTKIFAEATIKYLGRNITLWLGDELLIDASVMAPITDGVLRVTGNYTKEAAEALAGRIRTCRLPLALTRDYTDIIVAVQEETGE